MSLWSDIRKVRKDGNTSQSINLGRANEFIDNLEAGSIARVTVEEDRVIIQVLELSNPEEIE